MIGYRLMFYSENSWFQIIGMETFGFLNTLSYGVCRKKFLNKGMVIDHACFLTSFLDCSKRRANLLMRSINSI